MTGELTDPGAELYCPTCELHFFGGQLCPDDGTRLVRLGGGTDPLVGRELDGRYTIIEKLGQGGMGAVYRARQHSMGREVAIKVVAPALVSDADAIKRFLREAKLASRLSHPNVVGVVDFGQTRDGVFYLVMELVQGRTLHDELVAHGTFPLARLLRIGSGICDALEGAHGLPMIHRDLKPANVMLLATGRDLVKVLDFGLAKSLAPDLTGGTVTSAGALLGTPTFMPPEVANGQPVDPRADLYSLGCILYMMGTGHPPFVTDSIPEMIAMHGTHPAPPMTGVPPAVAHVIDRLLRKSPGERYPTASAVREALESAVEQSRAQVTFADPIDDAIAGAASVLASGPPHRASEEVLTGQYAVPVTVPRSLPPPHVGEQTLVRPQGTTRRQAWLILAISVAIALVGAAITMVVLRRGATPLPAAAAPFVVAPMEDSAGPAGAHDASVEHATAVVAPDAVAPDAAPSALGAGTPTRAPRKPRAPARASSSAMPPAVTPNDPSPF